MQRVSEGDGCPGVERCGHFIWQVASCMYVLAGKEPLPLDVGEAGKEPLPLDVGEGGKEPLPLDVHLAWEALPRSWLGS